MGKGHREGKGREGKGRGREGLESGKWRVVKGGRVGSNLKEIF
jgi:hypothetical protein